MSYFSRGFQAVGLWCCVALSKCKERQLGSSSHLYIVLLCKVGAHNTLPGPNVSILAPLVLLLEALTEALHQACVQGRQYLVPLKGGTLPTSTFYSSLSLSISL